MKFDYENIMRTIAKRFRQVHQDCYYEGIVN